MGVFILGNRDGPAPIRVLVADDSLVMRSALARMLKHSPRIQLCGFAANGAEAVEKARLLQPDVITLDVMMPVLDGLEALRQIMQERPCPVIMVSALTLRDAEVTLEALSLGAFHYIPKEEIYRADTHARIRSVLLDAIEAAAQSPLSARREEFRPQEASPGVPPCRRTALHRDPALAQIVAIGSSTGGPKALEEILTVLPGDFPVPVVVVQHMPAGFTGALAERLDGVCELRVREARQGEAIQPGSVYIAPAGKHMTVFNSQHEAKSVCLADFPNGTLHKPSVDVLMLSVADTFAERSIGIILTGMGSDGLRGMTAIHERGGITMGQERESSAVYGMPRVCAEHGILQKSLAPAEIAHELLKHFTARAHA